MDDLDDTAYMILKEVELEVNERAPTATKMTPASVKPLTEDVVQSVVSKVSSDPILIGSNSNWRKTLSNINVKQLTQMLHPLERCLTSRGIFTAVTREKAWAAYHSIQGQLSTSIDSLIHHPQLSSFILLTTMEEFLLTNAPPSSLSTPSANDELSQAECDILIYVGGFVLFRSRKQFRFNELCYSVVSLLMKGEGEQFVSALIRCKTRGGLCEPKEDMISFFKLCELIFRAEVSSFQQHSLQLFVNSICHREDILALFCRCVYSHNVDSEAQETVLLHILSGFFHLRCHAKCRQLFELYLLKSKTVKKQKALRKTVLKT